MQPLALAWGEAASARALLAHPAPAPSGLLALTLATEDSIFLEGCFHELIIRLLEEALSGTCGGRGMGGDERQ